MLVPFTLCLLSTISLIRGHVYHMGGKCADVEPMPGFQMEKLLGEWHAIQKSSSSNKCMTYTFKKTVSRREYKVTQMSQSPYLGMLKDHVCKYTGNLEFEDDNNQANMLVHFPMSIMGKSSFIVFMTDYDNYAGIYACQQVGFARRESATILSRKPTLHRSYLEKIRNRLASYNINPFDLTTIDHTNCDLTDGKFTIDITDTTFDKENIKSTLKKVAEAVGNGVERFVDKARKIYNFVNGKEEKPSPVRDREETTVEPYAEML